MAGCHEASVGGADDSGDEDPGRDGGQDLDAADVVPVVRTLYPEGPRHSPITPDVVARLGAIASIQARDGRVFAKVGDSITVAPEFLNCFAGTTVALGSNQDLATTLEHFRAGDAEGTTPFTRVSLAAKGGTTAAYMTSGSPCPLQHELDAINPRISVLMFGTNEVRFGWTLDAYAEGLWQLVDETIDVGTIPIVSTIPPMRDPGADARIPTFNRVVRGIAQGRGVPLIDLHRVVNQLPNRGLAPDGIHLSVAAQGGCDLTDGGLQGGYNVRNLMTLEALARTTGALDGTSADSSATLRAGSGTLADPWIGELPLVDLGDTRDGSPVNETGCGGRMLSGREVIYRLDLTAETAISAHVVDRPGTEVDVQVFAGSVTPASCVASGDQLARATVGPGPVFVVVDGPDVSTDGEYVLVVEPR